MELSSTDTPAATAWRSRLLPGAARLYPALDRNAWYPAEDPHDAVGGLWFLAPWMGDPILNPGRLYVFKRHLEVVG